MNQPTSTDTSAIPALRAAPPRVVIFGGGSALGRAVVRALREDPATTADLRVWVSARSATKTGTADRLVESGGRLIAGSMRDRVAVADALDGADIVYHCQTPVPARILGLFYATIVLCDAARAGRPHIVYPGSPWVAGLPESADGMLRAGDRMQPRGHLAREMFRIERLLVSAREMWDVPSTIVRLPDMVGAGCELHPWGRIWDAAASGTALHIPFGTEVPREWIHVDDAARALVAAGRRGAQTRAVAHGVPGEAITRLARAAASVHEICAAGGGVDSAREFALAVAHAHQVTAVAPVGVTGAALAARAITDAGIRAMLSLSRLYRETVRLDGSTAAALGYAPRITRETLAAGRRDSPSLKGGDA